MKKFDTRLIRYELRKAFLNPWMLLFLVVLLLMNAWKLNTEYTGEVREITPYRSVYEDFYSRWKGPITQEHIGELMSIYGPLQKKEQEGTLSHEQDPNAYTYSEARDQRFFEVLFATEMEYDYLYQNEALRITQKAQDLVQLYSNIGNRYEVKKNTAILELFQGRTIPQFADTHWVEAWLYHDYSAMLVLLLCVFGLCTVFVTERETEMYMLLRTSKMGGGATVAAKLIASALFCVVVSLLFFGEDVLFLLARSGHPEAVKSPVYAIRYLESTPLRMSIGQFQLWTIAVKTLGILGCGCFILLISCLCRRILTTFVAGFGWIMALTVVQELSSTRYALKWFNPMELVISREIVTETKFVNLLGQPVLIHVYVIAGILLTMAALYVGILYYNPGRMGRRG